MMRDTKDYRILVIEDNPGDFTLVEDFLHEQIKSPLVVHAPTFKKAKEILCGQAACFTAILLDLSLPDKTGNDLITEIIEQCPGIPIIVLTGYTDFAFGVRSLSLGVSDYILKEELTSMALYKSILYSIERKKALIALQLSEKKYSELFHLNPLPMWLFDIESLEFLDVNAAAIKNYGYTKDEFLSMTIREIRPPEEIARLENTIARYKGEEKFILQGIYKHKKKDGTIIQVDIESNTIQYKGKPAKVILAYDVTERLNYIREIEEQNTKLKEISWIQSHVVRAPLARLIGLVQLIKDLELKDLEKAEILDYILLSANDLDDVIKDINRKTERTSSGNGDTEAL